MKNGADVNHTEKYSLTALLFSAERNTHDVAKLLIEHDANLFAANKYGVQPIHVRTIFCAIIVYISKFFRNS